MFARSTVTAGTIVRRGVLVALLAFGLVVGFQGSATLQAQDSTKLGESSPALDSPKLLKSDREADLVSPERQQGSSLRDPTVPTDRILQQFPQQTETIPKQTRQKRSLAPPSVTPLPKLPVITLRGIAMSKPDRGKAILNVDGKSISISLIPRERQTRFPIPTAQFSLYKPVLKKREADSTDPDPAVAQQNQKGVNSRRPEPEMCIECSFTHNGLVFNLEAFTSDSLLFKALPHGDLIIVRNQLP